MFMPQTMQSLYNVPLAVHDNIGLMLASSAMNRLDIHARVRGRHDLGEADGRQALASLAALNGAPMTAGPTWRPYEMTDSGIAIIRVNGMLVRSCDIWDMIFGGVTSYEAVWNQILFAQDDAQCRGIFMVVNSWGGIVDGLVDLADGIAALSARNGGKPIFGMAADFAYSAAYTLLSACDNCYVPETGGVGSAAVIIVTLDVTGAMEQQGVSANIFRSLDRKAIGIDGVEAMDDEAKQHMQQKVETVGAVLTRKIASYRSPLTQNAISGMRGLDYTGTAAKAIGLVTDVASEPEALAKLERRIAR
jgi:ClpP class serine protease